MRCYHDLPPSSLHAMGVSESLSCSQVSLELMLNCLQGSLITLTNLDKIYEHAIWDTQVRSLDCGFNSEPYCSEVCGYQPSLQTLAEICRSMGNNVSFRAVAAREKYPRFVLLSSRNINANFFTWIANSSASQHCLSFIVFWFLCLWLWPQLWLRMALI